MKLLFILDPLTSLKLEKDTSLAIMREAAQRGHELFVAEQEDLVMRDAIVSVHCEHFRFTGNSPVWYSTEPADVQTLPSFSAVMMRKDPPVDLEYVYSTYLLEQAQQQGATVLNRPQSVLEWNEKLAVAQFSEFAPPFLVTRQMALIRSFLVQHSDIVVKPLDGMGGAGVFRIKTDDPNIGVILETATHFGRRTVMAQRYIPEIKDGDKRILMINGEPAPYCLARIPQPGETRGNLAAGGTGVAQLLTQRDLQIAKALGPVLREKGLFLVGLDVIGEHLTEINVTSPTCMVEIAAQTDCDPASLFMDALERLAA
jgi:glutathione synthase